MSATLDLPLLIEPEQLVNELDNEQLILVDICKTTQYQQSHIIQAIHIPYQYLHLGTKPAPGLLPEQAQLEQVMSYIDLTADKHVVAYDDQLGAGATRFLWILSTLGHLKFSLLNGGIQHWAQLGLPMTTEVPNIAQRQYAITETNLACADKDYILENLDNAKMQLWDSRSVMEYNGTKKYSLFAGHIPNAIHLEWLECIDTQLGKVKPLPELQSLLNNKGFDLNKEIITYCQTHHRSCFTFFILKLLGCQHCKGYAGSWSEWGNHASTPKTCD